MLKIVFREGTVVREGMKPLYDISSRCHLSFLSDKIVLQALNPERTMGINCEFPCSLYEGVGLGTKLSMMGQFDLTRVFKDIKMQTQKNDVMPVEVTEENRLLIHLERSIGLAQQQQLAQQTLAANLKKRKRVKKQQVLKLERKETSDGEEQRLLICNTKFTRSTKMVQFRRGFDYPIQERAVLYLPSLELQTACGELAVIGPLVTVSTHPSILRFSGSGSNGKIEFDFADRFHVATASLDDSSSSSSSSSTSSSVPSAVFVPPTMLDFHQTYPLQKILHCMQILSQCKYITLFFIRNAPLIMTAETSNGVCYHVYITPSISPPPAVAPMVPFSDVLGKESTIQESKVEDQDPLRMEERIIEPNPQLPPPPRERVNLSGLQPCVFRPRPKKAKKR